MKIAVVILSEEDEKPFASFIAGQGLHNHLLQVWQCNAAHVDVQQLLPALVAAFDASPVDTFLFPASAEGDELATRLAWRLDGVSVCQVSGFNAEAGTMSKAVYGNALIATLRSTCAPLCLSLSRNLTLKEEKLSADYPTRILEPVVVAGGLAPPVILNKAESPLQSAKWVLATGQGASDEVFAQLAASLQAEAGFTRQRVMAGGCDEQRMIGISGLRVQPEVCIIAGASGASAFMSGVQQSGLIVAINTDPSAPIFAAADVGIVGDAAEVLTALVECLPR